MSENKKWKDKLLASSLPLEFEAAKILVSKGYWVTSDYTYSRESPDGTKDFSVDIEATAYTPFTDRTKITSDITLLVECKYRNPDTKWLFLPDPNKDPEFSPFWPGNSIRIIDEFSYCWMNKKPSFEFDNGLPLCYKGIELKGDSNVYDSEIKHGISQLQYALPGLITKNISNCVLSHPEDNVPIIFCPILLSTANLFVLNSGVSMKSVKSASNIEDLTTEVPYLVQLSNCNPDFNIHRAKKCSFLSTLNQYEKVIQLESKIKNSKYNEYCHPSELGRNLANKNINNSKYFNTFLVCTYSSFPELIDNIKKTITRALRTRKQI